MKVGDKVYTFDSNRRVYPTDKTISSGPIYREHFVLQEILGETSQSWIVGYSGWTVDTRACTKHKKKAERPSLFTREQVEEQIYIHDNGHKIADLVYHVDYKTLKAIADLIGYKGA
jgi:hypothetical protein